MVTTEFIFEALVCVLVPCVIILAAFCIGAKKRIEALEHGVEVHLDAMASMAKTVGELSDWLTELDGKITKTNTNLEILQHAFDELPKEEMEEEYQRLVSFNTGIQNIIGFGPDVPKLNKEVLKHE